MYIRTKREEKTIHQERENYGSHDTEHGCITVSYQLTEIPSLMMRGTREGERGEEILSFTSVLEPLFAILFGTGLL